MTTSTKAASEPQPLLRLALDLGPVAVFFIGNALAKDIFVATGIFMAATVVAMILSVIRFGKVSPMQWFSSIMVVVLGGLAIWLREDWIIKMKPTLYYLILSGILGFGLWTGRPMLKLALGTAYPGLDERGWTLLSRNWAGFFLAMAIANELVWRNFSNDIWLGYKIWGAMPATMLFALANMPMLLRHGLGAETPAEVIAESPHQE